MELEAQKIVMEQQQAFKYEQHVTEHKAYVAMERQQRDMELQLERHTIEARSEEAAMMNKLRDVETQAVEYAENQEAKCSTECGWLRSYAAKLEECASQEVTDENLAEVQVAKTKIREAEEKAEAYQQEAIAQSHAASIATRAEEHQAAFLTMQLQSRLSSHEMISEGLVSNARMNTEQFLSLIHISEPTRPY